MSKGTLPGMIKDNYKKTEWLNKSVQAVIFKRISGGNENSAPHVDEATAHD